jgi:hypothetical protein
VRDFSSIVDAIFFFLCQQDPLGQVDPRAHVAFFRLFGLFLSHVPVPGRSRIFRTVSQEVSYTINLEFDEFSLFTGLSDLQISAARLELKNQSSCLPAVINRLPNLTQFVRDIDFHTLQVSAYLYRLADGLGAFLRAPRRLFWWVYEAQSTVRAFCIIFALVK